MSKRKDIIEGGLIIIGGVALFFLMWVKGSFSQSFWLQNQNTVIALIMGFTLIVALVTRLYLFYTENTGKAVILVLALIISAGLLSKYKHLITKDILQAFS